MSSTDRNCAAGAPAGAAEAAEAESCDVLVLERHGGARLRERRARLVQALRAHRAEAAPWLPSRRPRGPAAQGATPSGAASSPLDGILAPLDLLLDGFVRKVRARPWPWLAAAAGAGAACAALRPQRLLRLGAAWFVPLALNDLRHFIWSQGKGAVGRVLQAGAHASDAAAPR